MATSKISTAQHKKRASRRKAIAEKIRAEIEEITDNIALLREQITHAQQPNDLPDTLPQRRSLEYTMGQFDQQARYLLDATQDLFTEWAELDDDNTEDEVRNTQSDRVAEIALDATLEEINLVLQKDQSEVAPVRRRALITFRPLLIRIQDFAQSKDLKQRIIALRQQLEQLIEEAGEEDEEIYAAAATQQKKIRKERSWWELGILLFFILVVAVILIFKNLEMNFGE